MYFYMPETDFINWPTFVNFAGEVQEQDLMEFFH